jgi:hypothetical protein
MIAAAVLILLPAVYQIAKLGFSYDFQHSRNIAPLNEELKSRVRTVVHKGMSVEEIMDATNDLVAGMLQYDMRRSDTDPVRVVQRGKVNCAGYAAVQVAMLNYAFQTFGHKGVRAEWHSGKVCFAGIWLGPYLGNHCYPVVIEKGGKRHYPDATFKDVLLDGYLVSREHM